jgi:hypothetical protein
VREPTETVAAFSPSEAPRSTSSSTHCGDHVVIEQGLRDESEPGAEFNSGFAGRLLRTNVAVGALIDDEEAGAAHLADVEAVSGYLGRASLRRRVTAGGVLTSEQTEKIQVTADDVSRFEFCRWTPPRTGYGPDGPMDGVGTGNYWTATLGAVSSDAADQFSGRSVRGSSARPRGGIWPT